VAPASSAVAAMTRSGSLIGGDHLLAVNRWGPVLLLRPPDYGERPASQEFLWVYASDMLPARSATGEVRNVSKHGDQLAGDLYRLRRAGEAVLPEVADVYRDAAKTLSVTLNENEAVFLRPPVFSGGHTGPVEPAWSRLCVELIDVFRRSAENIDECGRALCLAADRYAHADTAAGAALADLMQRNPIATDENWLHEAHES
jgi:hypothetical protein